MPYESLVFSQRLTDLARLRVLLLTSLSVLACGGGSKEQTPEVDARSLPVCGDGLVDVSEECDDGNRIDGDGCDSNCGPSACGNGIHAGEEGCDDGNRTNGDGCDSDCIVEGEPLEPIVYLKASNTGELDGFGASVALYGDTLVVGVPGEDSSASGVNGDEDNDDAPNSGAVYVFRRTGVAWAQEAYIKASNVQAEDYFGTAVVVFGDTLVVGARGEDSAATGIDGDQSSEDASDSGAVYVFRRTGNSWVQEAYIKASNTDARDEFGRSLALFDDTLVVGAPNERSSATGVDGFQESNAALRSGAAYVFRRVGESWRQESYLKASNTDANDSFGWSLSLSEDLLAVGATGEASNARGIDGEQGNNALASSGAVYLFRRSGSSWLQEAYVKAPNADYHDLFGWDLALSEDTLAVGAISEGGGSAGIDGDANDNSKPASGAVYVFRRTEEEWVEEAYLKASNSDLRDEFGRSVALHGGVLVVGALNEDSDATGLGGSQAGGAINSGAAYVFRREGTDWQQAEYVKASNTGAGDSFGGTSVAVFDEAWAVGAVTEDGGASGVMGDPNDDSIWNSGAVYLYQ